MKEFVHGFLMVGFPWVNDSSWNVVEVHERKREPSPAPAASNVQHARAAAEELRAELVEEETTEDRPSCSVLASSIPPPFLVLASPVVGSMVRNEGAHSLGMVIKSAFLAYSTKAFVHVVVALAQVFKVELLRWGSGGPI